MRVKPRNRIQRMRVLKRGGSSKQRKCFCGIRLNALALVITYGEIVECNGVIRVSCTLEHLRGQLQVLLHSFAVFIKEAEVVQRFTVSKAARSSFTCIVRCIEHVTTGCLPTGWPRSALS
jgi:hypothetical protein